MTSRPVKRVAHPLFVCQILRERNILILYPARCSFIISTQYLHCIGTARINKEKGKVRDTANYWNVKCQGEVLKPLESPERERDVISLIP